MKTMNFGIVGAGTGAGLIASGLKLLEERGVAKLVAVSSAHKERAKKFAEKYGIKKWFACHREMFRESDIDAVAVSTPHHLHFPITLDSIEYGLHVLVDKPIAINLREADEMISRARRSGVKLGVIHELRFGEGIQKIKAVIEDGFLGRLIMGEASVKWFRTEEYYKQSSWRGRWATEGGGALINQAIHSIDLLIWFMGPIDELWATISTMTHDIEVEDTAVATLKFKNEALGVIQASTSIYPGFPNRVEIHGSDGTAIIEGDRVKSLLIKGGRPFIDLGEKRLEVGTKPEGVPADLYVKLLIDFIDAIVEDREPLVNGEEGRRALEVIRAIYRSSKERKPIRLPMNEF